MIINEFSQNFPQKSSISLEDISLNVHFKIHLCKQSLLWGLRQMY